jgi:hypothetical protein
VAFNAVTAVDDKHCLIANFFTDNITDRHLLAESTIAVKAEFDTNFHPDLHKSDNDTEGVDLTTQLDPNKPLNVLADKGFHTASELKECADNLLVTPTNDRTGTATVDLGNGTCDNVYTVKVGNAPPVDRQFPTRP